MLASYLVLMTYPEKMIHYEISYKELTENAFSVS